MNADRIERARGLVFYSNDLGRKTTIKEWLLLLLTTLMTEDEGFSGKRPFGNSSWRSDAEAALIKAGLLKGKLDDEGFIESVEDSTPLFCDIIDSF